MNDPAEAWVRRAQEDLAVARHASQSGWHATACFHAQQSAEKWLKALLVQSGLRPPRTHDLGVLADTLAAFVAVDAIREAALVLTEYAVDARYPGTDVDADEATQAVAYAECVQRWAETTGL